MFLFGVYIQLCTLLNPMSQKVILSAQRLAINFICETIKYAFLSIQTLMMVNAILLSHKRSFCLHRGLLFCEMAGEVKYFLSIQTFYDGYNCGDNGILTHLVYKCGGGTS